MPDTPDQKDRAIPSIGHLEHELEKKLREINPGYKLAKDGKGRIRITFTVGDLEMRHMVDDYVSAILHLGEDTRAVAAGTVDVIANLVTGHTDCLRPIDTDFPY